MLIVQLTRSRPAQFLTHVRDVIKFATAGHDAQSKILDLLEASHVSIRTVAVHGKTVSDVREDQSIDHGGKKFMRNLMAHVGQPDEDTIAFFDDCGYVRVPGEMLI